MAIRFSREDTRRGISPDQARADYLARSLEEIRRVLAKPVRNIDQLRATLRSVNGVLDRIPPQF